MIPLPRLLPSPLFWPRQASAAARLRRRRFLERFAPGSRPWSRPCRDLIGFWRRHLPWAQPGADPGAEYQTRGPGPGSCGSSAGRCVRVWAGPAWCRSWAPWGPAGWACAWIMDATCRWKSAQGLAFASCQQGPRLMHPAAMTYTPSGGSGWPGCFGSLLPELPRPGAAVCFQPAEEIAQERPGCCAWRHGGVQRPCSGLACVSKAWRWAASGARGSLTPAAGELEVEVAGRKAGTWAPDPTSRSMRSGLRRGLVKRLQEAISRRLDALQPVGGQLRRIRGGQGLFNVDRPTTLRLLEPFRCLPTPTVARPACRGWNRRHRPGHLAAAYGGEAKVALPLALHHPFHKRTPPSRACGRGAAVTLLGASR